MLINHADPNSFALPDNGDHGQTLHIKECQQKALDEVGGSNAWEIVDSIYLEGRYAYSWFTVIVCQHKQTREVKTVIYEDN